MYQIIIKKAAKKFIDRLPTNEKRRIVSAIERLPNGEDIKKLKGHDGLSERAGAERLNMPRNTFVYRRNQLLKRLKEKF